jgi:hypothetical protein
MLTVVATAVLGNSARNAPRPFTASNGGVKKANA